MKWIEFLKEGGAYVFSCAALFSVGYCTGNNHGYENGYTKSKEYIQKDLDKITSERDSLAAIIKSQNTRSWKSADKAAQEKVQEGYYRDELLDDIQEKIDKTISDMKTENDDSSAE